MTKKHANWGWVFVSPYVLGLSILFVGPILFMIYISFTQYNMYAPPQFVGLRNYVEVLGSSAFWYALRNVALYAAVFVPCQTIIACILASALNQKIKFVKLYRVIYYLPVITPWVGISLIWGWLYNPTYGMLNYLLSFLGFGPFSYVSSINWQEVIISIAVVSVWKGVGYITVILLAGIQGISNDVMEAAEIDGAGAYKKFTKITLPLLSPTIFLVLILGTLNAMQVFDPFYVMLNTSGSNVIRDQYSVLSLHIYNNAFLFSKVGIASTTAWLTFAVIAAITFIQNKLESRWVHYE